MKTITKTLPTGIVTTQKDKGGRIEVSNNDYDCYFDQPLLDSDVKVNLFETFSRMFKPLTQN